MVSRSTTGDAGGAGGADDLRRRSIRRVTGALILTALAALIVVGTGAVIVAKRIARDDALSEAIRSAQSTAAVVFAPAVRQLRINRVGAMARLDAEVAARHRNGIILRLKIWTRDGEVVYSDNHKAIGKRFPLDSAVTNAIDTGRSSADISNLTAKENFTETGLGSHLVEVYTPLDLAPGQRMALEIYSSDARVHEAENLLIGKLVPFALLSSLVLIVLQLPVSVWLVRRVARGSAERATLLGRVLTVSENERRSIAHDLHDSVVQDLAGAGYALNSLTTRPPRGTDQDDAKLLVRVAKAVQDAVGSLRTLIVDIYPPDLSITGMHAAVSSVAETLRESGIEVSVTVDNSLESADVSADVAAMLYRCARECITNIANHAQARHAWVTIGTDGPRVLLTIADDGVGLPPTGIDRRSEGHLGLRLLRDAVEGMGGHLQATTRPQGGTTVVVDLPSDGTANF